MNVVTPNKSCRFSAITLSYKCVLHYSAVIINQVCPWFIITAWFLEITFVQMYVHMFTCVCVSLCVCLCVCVSVCVYTSPKLLIPAPIK